MTEPASNDRELGDLYDELRRLANHLLRAEPPGQTLQATALVHEAWMKLAGYEKSAWGDRRHLLNQAALIMRRQLIDRARRRRLAGARKDDDVLDRIEMPVTRDFTDDQLVALGDAIERLRVSQPRGAEAVSLKYFIGLRTEEIADLLEVSASTIRTDLQFARSWLMDELK